MAQYKHLPIYKATYDLLLKVTEATRHYPRDFKHSTGAMLRDEVMYVVLLIYRANASRQQRAEITAEIVERLQVIELLLRLSNDMRFISPKQFSSIVVMTDAIVRQAAGWHRSTSASAE